MSKLVMFEAEGPDGTIFRFRAPENSTPEQLNQYAAIEYQNRMGARPAPMPAAAPPEPSAGLSGPTSGPPSGPPVEPPMGSPVGPEAAPEEDFEARLKRLQQEQDIGQAQLFGGGAGAGLAGVRLGRDIGMGAAQALGKQAELGRISAQGGTSGEKWARNWAGYEQPGVGGVPEASASYQRRKGQGPVSSRMSKMWGVAGPNEPRSLVDRLIARGMPVRPSGLDQATALFKGMLGPIARYALPPVALAGAAGEAVRGTQQLEEGDKLGATLSGISALGGLASLYPPAAVVGAPVALGAGALQYARGRLAPNEPVSPREEEEASRAAFGIYPRMAPRRSSSVIR